MEMKKIKNLFELFKLQLEKNPNKKFLFEKKNNEWISISYSEIFKKVIYISSYLIKRNIQKGDRVLLLSQNRIEWFIFDLSIQFIGGVTVPSFVTNSSEDNGFIIKDCKPKVIIIENEKYFKDNIKLFTKYDVRNIISIDSCKGLNDLEYICSQEKTKKPKIIVKRNDLSSIIYTSGTSGNLKGVKLSHGSILYNCDAAYELIKSLKINKERFLSFLPLSHSYERMAGLYVPLCINAEIYYCNQLERISEYFKSVKPTIVTAVPRLYENIYKRINSKLNNSNIFIKLLFKLTKSIGTKKINSNLSLFEKFLDIFICFIIKKKIRQTFGGKIKSFISGGAALEPSVGDFFLSCGVNILQGYGQTEAGPLISCNTIEKNSTKTVGFPIKYLTVKISKEKEILVKGPSIMLGYWNNSQLTKKTLKNNWLHTGDLGVIDTLGRLIINGRKKDLIVTSNGENISPQKIENLLSSQPLIDQAVIYGNSKPYLIALIVPTKDIKKSVMKKLLIRINDKLSFHEKVRKHLIIENPFTYKNGFLTQTLKIKKEKVFRYYENEIKKLYSNL